MVSNMSLNDMCGKYNGNNGVNCDKRDKLEEALRMISKYCTAGDEDWEEPGVVEFSLSEDDCNMVAVDGSYTFLFHVSSIWLGVIKVCALTYSFENGRYNIKDKCFFEEPVLLSTNESMVVCQDDIFQNLFRSTKNSSDQVKEMMNKYRGYREQEIALRIAEKCRGSLLVLDGTLSGFPSPSLSKRLEMIDELKDVCEERDNALVGVSKDSYTHAFNSARTDEELLESMETVSGKRGYVRVPPSFEERQRGVLYGDVYFAKLHPNAPKWFRVDLGTFQDSPSLVFSQLGNYSLSTICLGYPFPLLEAHRFAVTVRQLRRLYEERLIKLASKCSLSPQKILKGLTHIEGQPKGSFHEYLDRIARNAK